MPPRCFALAAAISFLAALSMPCEADGVRLFAEVGPVPGSGHQKSVIKGDLPLYVHVYAERKGGASVGLFAVRNTARTADAISMDGLLEISALSGTNPGERNAKATRSNAARGYGDLWSDEEFTVGNATPYRLFHALRDSRQAGMAGETRIVLNRKTSGGGWEETQAVSPGRSGFAMLSGTLEPGTYQLRFSISASTKDTSPDFLGGGRPFIYGIISLAVRLELGAISPAALKWRATDVEYFDPAARLHEAVRGHENGIAPFNGAYGYCVGNLPLPFDKAFKTVLSPEGYFVRRIDGSRHRILRDNVARLQVEYPRMKRVHADFVKRCAAIDKILPMDTVNGSFLEKKPQQLPAGLEKHLSGVDLPNVTGPLTASQLKRMRARYETGRKALRQDLAVVRKNCEWLEGSHWYVASEMDTIVEDRVHDFGDDPEVTTAEKVSLRALLDMGAWLHMVGH